MAIVAGLAVVAVWIALQLDARHLAKQRRGAILEAITTRKRHSGRW